MAQTVKWLPRPEKHDFQAAEDYLSLVMSAKRAADGYHRVCASYWIDENTDIPCIVA